DQEHPAREASEVPLEIIPVHARRLPFGIVVIEWQKEKVIAVIEIGAMPCQGHDYQVPLRGLQVCEFSKDSFARRILVRENFDVDLVKHVAAMLLEGIGNAF